MEARCRNWVQERYRNVQRPFTYGGGERRTYSFHLCQAITHAVSCAQEKGDDHQSVAAILTREREKNKLSSIERAWFAGSM